MKRFLSLVLVIVLGMGTVLACVKKKSNASPVPDSSSDVTIIVMDTTQALLPYAELTIGKTVFRTSFDGKIVLTAEQAANAKKPEIVCKGYESQKINLSDASPILVALTPKPYNHSSYKEDKTPGSGLKSRTREAVTLGAMDEMVYKSLPAPMPDARPIMMTEDYAVAEEMPARELPGGAVSNNVAAGMLTAGEVNDFTKWAFWSTVIDSTHKQFISDWKIAPRKRYTVQVTNKQGYPIANYPVSLLDAKGNTVFQAVTDNTGKAELWANLMVNGKPVEVQEPEKQIVVDEPCTNGEALTTNDQSDVDVMFVFDATGSMGDELRYLQAEMKDVIGRATDATGGLKIRTGAVVYRDHQDEYLTRISRLTDDIATTQSFIDKQHAAGGGDWPEAVPEALMAALNSAGWNESARARIAFLVLDAPCHKDSAALTLMHEQILNAAALGVRIVPVVCSGLDESGELLMRSIALATNGTSFFLTDDSGIGNTHLKPTTDSLKVEHLNDMLVRTIVEFSYMPTCGRWNQEQIDNVDADFIPNPFTAIDVANDPTIKHGPTTLYLLDISGKLITVYEGSLDDAGDAQLSRLGVYLSTGIYFVKAFYDGEWHTKKILVH